MIPAVLDLAQARPRKLEQGERSWSPDKPSAPCFGARRALGLTQDEVAERSGVSVRTISNLERGASHVPHADTVMLLAEVLGLGERERVAFATAANRQRVSAAIVPPRRGLGTVAGDRALAPFVGRQRELALLDRHLAGQGPPVLLLAGEPGIGKTRLLRVAAPRAIGQGLAVLEGGCQRRGGQEPYAPLLVALKGYIRRQTPAQQRVALRGCAWLVRLLPELADTPIEPLPTWVLPPGQERRLMFEAVVQFLTNVAEQSTASGIVILLDDLQWAGPDALDLLGAVAHAAAPGLRLVGAYRDTEVGPDDPLSATLADLAHAGLAARHALGPLAADEAGQLLDSLLEADSQDATVGAVRRERLVRLTGGVPFFLVSCAQGLQSGTLVGDTEEGVPWNVAQGLRQRVAALPEVARDVLGVAAMVGRVVQPTLLRAVIARPEPLLLSALDATCRARLLVETPEEGYRFPHDVIREVVETDLGLARRAALHRQVAEVLESQMGVIPIELVAYHYARSDNQDRALEYLVKAAERADQSLAYGEAAALLGQAIAIAVRLGKPELVADLHTKRARAFDTSGMWGDSSAGWREGAGRWHEAQSDLELAFKALPPEAIEQRARVQLHLAEVSYWLSDPAAMRGYASDGLALAEAAGHVDLAAEALAWLAGADKCDGDLRSSLDRFKRSLRRMPDLCLPAFIPAPLVSYLVGQRSEAAMLAQAGVDAARAANDATALSIHYPVLGLALTTSGRYSDALHVFEESRRFCRANDLPHQLARSIGMSSGLHLDLFDFAHAEQIAEEARELARSVNWALTVASAGIDLLLNFARRQEVDRAERLVDEVAIAVEASTGWHVWLCRLRLAQARAEIALARGHWEDAIQLADRALAHSRQHGRVKYQAAGLRTRGQALAAGGQVREAIADLREALALARLVDDPALVLTVATALLPIDGDDALAGDARTVANRIVQALPDEQMRRRFLEAEPLRILGRSQPPAASLGE